MLAAKNQPESESRVLETLACAHGAGSSRILSSDYTRSAEAEWSCGRIPRAAGGGLSRETCWGPLAGDIWS